MKARAILHAALTLSASSALAESPAKLICDGFEGSSASDRAQRIVRFSQSIDSPLANIDSRDQACVVTKLDSLEETRRVYCESRSSLGHDLAANPLEHLTSELFSVRSDCERPRLDAEKALYDKMLPKSCDELLSSSLAFLDFYESNSEDARTSLECYRAKVRQEAPSLEKACTDGALSLRAAFTEIQERASGTCAKGP